MYPSVKRELPEFIEKYFVYCDCFMEVNKQRSCWVLTKNLKFFEFCQKQLVASIDLQSTCLQKIKEYLLNYKGSRGKWYETSNHPNPPAKSDNAVNQIYIGKYAFHALNIFKIYIIIQCWDKCVVLKRLPGFKGFEIKAEYDNLLSYRIIHGPIKFCPLIEFEFQNHESLKTDFEEELCTKVEHDLNNKPEIRQLLERIRSNKTELQLHKSITDQSFHSLQSNLTFGQPFMRTYKLEEKQILNRCGDIWKRLTAHEDLIIGVPLVNQCAAPNITIIRNLMPVLYPSQSPESSIQLQYRLYQLNLKFDELDTLKTYLESEDVLLQKSVWSSSGDLQILPESFVLLLIKLRIAQIIHLKQSVLILNYEVSKHLESTNNTVETYAMPLQLFLQNLDFHKLLMEERHKCELKFDYHTLHQDFLTIAMSSQETNLNISFENTEDLRIFENFIQDNLNFKTPTTVDSQPENVTFQHLIFYNKIPSSVWFGSLILRMREQSEDYYNPCVTTWRIYCQNYDKTLLLIKTFLSDMLPAQCNVLSITNSEDNKNSLKHVNIFENALRQELLQIQEIIRDIKTKKITKEHLQKLENLCQLQMNTDNIAIKVIDN